jgi:hypothetical protein
MEKPVIDKYFAKKGINVRFNTLGYNETLIRSYLKDFQTEVNDAYRKKSEDVKHACYNKLYPVKSRPKFTGFETLKKQDKDFRKNINMFVTAPQFSPLMTVEHIDNETWELSYKDALKASIKDIENPIVYLSGGLDSEIVANAFVDLGKSFIPLIYYYVDETGNLLNKHDIGYAYAFCRKHGLFPIIKQINVPKLWETKEFKELAIDIQLVSPHLVTYAYMINLTNQEYPNHTHVFGGEVRFSSDYTYADRNYNLVFLDKVVPGYNGSTYTSSNPLLGPANWVTLQYNGNTLTDPGEWILYIYSEGFGQPFPADSGAWTTTPSLGPYEIRVNSATKNYSIPTTSGPENLYWEYYPTAPYAYFTLDANNYTICYCRAGPTPGGQAYQIDATFGIQVKVVGEVTPVVSSSINLIALSENT